MTFDVLETGNRIRQLRQALGYTQDRLASLVCIDRVQLARIESGKRRPSIETIVILAEVLHVSADYLLTGITTVPPPLKVELTAAVDQLTKLIHLL